MSLRKIPRLMNPAGVGMSMTSGSDFIHVSPARDTPPFFFIWLRRRGGRALVLIFLPQPPLPLLCLVYMVKAMHCLSASHPNVKGNKCRNDWKRKLAKSASSLRNRMEKGLVRFSIGTNKDMF